MGSHVTGGSVVVPAINAPSSVWILRSLGKRGVNTIAVSEYDRPSSFASKYVDERFAVPSPKTDLKGYRDALLKLAKRPDVKTIIPVREADAYVLATDRETFAEHVSPIWPTASSLRDVNDREVLFEVAEQVGVPIPETTLLSELDDWDGEHIVKGRYGFLTNDFVEGVPPNQTASPPKTIFLEPHSEPDVDAIIESMGHVPIVQDYVRGTEYCLRALYNEGEPIITSQKRLLRGYKYSRGPSIYHEAVDIKELEDLGLALLDELEWDGVASVGFIRDESGAFRLLEVNPRFWASLPIDMHGGIDFPGHFWGVATDDALPTPPTYRPGTKSHLLRGELAHLYSVVYEDYPMVERPSAGKTALDIATSIARHPNFDMASLDDPKPFIRDVSNAIRNELFNR